MEIKVPENNENEILMSDVIDSVWYVKLGDIPNDLLTDWARGLKFHKDRIFLMDGQKNEVFVFGIKGEHLYSLNAKGEGPGEFTRASSIAIDPFRDQLVVHDDRLSKLLYYTLQGEFIREHRVAYRFNDFEYVNDSIIAVDLNKTYNDHILEISNNQLVLVDTTWKVLAKGGAYNAAQEQKLFFTGDVFSRKGKELFYLRPFTYDIYRIDQDNLTPYCRIDFGNRTLPEETNFNFSEARDFWEEYPDYSYMVGNAHFLDDITYFEHLYEGSKTSHLFRSNNTGKLFHGRVNNDIYSLGFFQISTIIPEKNVLVSYLSSEEIYAKKKVILESNTASETLREMVSSTESTDNPVLIFYRLKTDY
nr:6-bladed beta-propeller [Algoriphagus locisalis]